jgi:hypothetical protein
VPAADPAAVFDAGRCAAIALAYASITGEAAGDDEGVGADVGFIPGFQPVSTNFSCENLCLRSSRTLVTSLAFSAP